MYDVTMSIQSTMKTMRTPKKTGHRTKTQKKKIQLLKKIILRGNWSNLSSIQQSGDTKPWYKHVIVSTEEYTE